MISVYTVIVYKSLSMIRKIYFKGFLPKWPLFGTKTAVLFMIKMTVVWPKWPLWTKMTDSHHQNDCYLEFTPKWPLFKASINYRSFWLEMIPKWPVFEKTQKWTLFMFERSHRYRWSNVLATSQAKNIKSLSPTTSNEMAQTGGRVAIRVRVQ